MDRQQILDLYQWSKGVCFRHPSKGDVPTAVVKTIRPRGEEGRDVRACTDCVIAIEDMRRETAARQGSEDLAGDPEPTSQRPCGGGIPGERLGSEGARGVDGESRNP